MSLKGQYKVGDRFRPSGAGSDVIYIYGLCDPEEPERMRYVGASIHPQQRLHNHHQGKSSDRVREWVMELSHAGKVPELVILEVVPKIAKSGNRPAESEWVYKLTAEGHDLLNYLSPRDVLTLINFIAKEREAQSNAS